MQLAIRGENGGFAILGPGVAVGYHRDMPEAVVVGSTAGGTEPLIVMRKCASHDEAAELVDDIVTWWESMQKCIVTAFAMYGPEPVFDVRTWRSKGADAS